ncbi:MAG: hypothetical protein ACW987_13970, partial [Candidatus Thorarchaeota archaeon]
FALERKLIEENSRAQQLFASQAVQGGDTQAIDDTRDAFARVADIVRELQSLGGGLDDIDGDRVFQFRADSAAVSSIQTRIQLENQLFAIIKRRRAEEKAATDEVAENNRKLTGVFAEVIEAQDAAFEKGLSEDEKGKRLDEFAKRRIEFLQLIKDNAEIGAKQLADFSNVLTPRGFQGIVSELHLTA